MSAKTTLRLSVPGRGTRDAVTDAIKAYAEMSERALGRNAAVLKTQLPALSDLYNYVTGLDLDDPRLVTLYELQIEKQSGDRYGFDVSELQTRLLSTLGHHGPTPAATTTFDEFVMAGVRDYIQGHRVSAGAVNEANERAQRLSDRLEEVEGQVAASDDALAAARLEAEDLRAENRNLDEALEHLRLFVPEGSADDHQQEEPKEKIDTDKRHKTATPGVTYRERADGSKRFSVLNNEGKQEPVEGDYDTAVERRVEILEEREGVPA